MVKKHIYFASDFHLGMPNYNASREREDVIVSWLHMIKDDAKEIFLLGDIFDFWFEYKTTIPKGFVRFLGKLAELIDSGIPVTLFRGNHDMWMFDYLSKELGVTIMSNELTIEREGARFYLHHGDGLGRGNYSYKCLKKIFRSLTCQWMFSCLHPDIGVWIAQKWSKSSRMAHHTHPFNQDKTQQEITITYIKDLLTKKHYDYIILGHHHFPIDISIQASRYINLGDWINYNSYAVFDGNSVQLKYFANNKK